MTSAPTKRKWVADNLGAVKERAVKVDPSADTSSALRISWALTRRGLALELAGLMNFESHERLKLKLLMALTRDPPDERFGAATVEQVRTADKEAWRLLSKKCSGSLHAASPADPTPLEVALGEVLECMEFNLALMPLPKAAGGTGGGDKRKKDSDDDGEAGLATPKKRSRAQRRNARVENLKKQVVSLQTAPAVPVVKLGGKQAGKGTPMPKALLGGVSVLPNGDRICFGWNLDSCSAAPAGGRCPKGVHVCTKKGCHGKHRASQCSM